MKILVAGMVAGVPYQGGASWSVLQYVLGFRALGHDVLLVEPVDQLTEGTMGYFEDLLASFDLRNRAALVVRGRRATVGMEYRDLERFADEADVLINIAGMLDDPDLRDRPTKRVYLDLDPAFTQLWQAVEGIDMRFDGHDRFVTVGTNIGTEASPVPTCGHAWIPTLPPVVLDRWPALEDEPDLPLTTVANWRGYGSVTCDGVQYGQKAHSLRPLFGLPQRVDGPFALALSIHPDERSDLKALAEHGWQLLDPMDAAGTPERYERFVQRSTAELGIAKSGYVVSRSGWISDRSACYLASGRPVIAQDTGIDGHLPIGEGFFTFANMADIATAVEEIRSGYTRQRKAAHDIAASLLDARRVLSTLLDAVAG